jgi:hypothetical protein
MTRTDDPDVGIDENGNLTDLYGECLSDDSWLVREQLRQKEGERVPQAG